MATLSYDYYWSVYSGTLADAAVEFIQVKFRQEGQHTLLHCADVLAGGVEDM